MGRPQLKAASRDAKPGPRCKRETDREREFQMLWINEGSLLDDAGVLLATSYVDLRKKEDRTPIRRLVKGCKREHALEDGETLLISRPGRFREYGVEMIRDDQEGLARTESVTLGAETPEEATSRRATSDLNDALQLVGSEIRPVLREEHSRRSTNKESFSYGKDWWVFCTSIRPDDDDWDVWRANLDEDYNHASEIGQPAQFAQALARMVVDQIGPLGQEAVMTGATDGEAGAQTKHKSQWVIHGPVVYTDDLHQMIAGEEDETRRMAALLFAKPMTHAAQREYRFVVLNGGAPEETVLLKISGAMRDALAPTELGLVRPSPVPAETVGEDGSVLPRGINASRKERYKRVTVTERKGQKQESRVETRASDGQVVSSDIKREESLKEKVFEQDLDPDDGAIREPPRTGGGRESAGERPVIATDRQSEEPKVRDDDAVAKEIALDEREWNDGHRRDEWEIPVFHRGSGRTYRSFKEMSEDPTAPTSPATKTWEVSACSPEELVKSYGAVATLAWKITRVAVEHRQEAASACWHALQCINHIYARLGDIVDSVWIERDRFVVIHLTESEELKATGRIVITPSGGYTYWLKGSKSRNLGYTKGHLGKLFFPLAHDVETFESFGWPAKSKDAKPESDESRDS